MDKRSIIFSLKEYPEMYIGYKLKCKYKDGFFDTGKIIGIFEHTVLVQYKYFRRAVSFNQMLCEDMLELDLIYE